VEDAEDGKVDQLCKTCRRWDDIRERVRLAELVTSAASKLETRLMDRDFKPTLGDYLKLLQLEKEVVDEQVSEIKVTWVLPKE
jgi:hypothetical protein